MMSIMLISLGITVTFYIYFWKKLTFNSLIFGTAVYLIHTFSYVYASIINPGIPKINKISSYSFATVGIKRYKLCKKCQVIMNLDIKTTHCNSCDICVEGKHWLK